MSNVKMSRCQKACARFLNSLSQGPPRTTFEQGFALRGAKAIYNTVWKIPLKSSSRSCFYGKPCVKRFVSTAYERRKRMQIWWKHLTGDASAPILWIMNLAQPDQTHLKRNDCPSQERAGHFGIDVFTRLMMNLDVILQVSNRQCKKNE